MQPLQPANRLGLDRCSIQTEVDMAADKLDLIFALREKFMKALNETGRETYLDWPVDLSDKASQQLLRDIALRGVEEMFEALQHLKNWKPHKTSEDPAFNREEFLEEMVDAFNYFFSMLVLVGVDPEELFEAYTKKDQKIHKRLQGDY